MDSVVIDYGLDPTGYMSGVGQVMAGNTSMQQSFASVTTGSSLMQRALGMVTPTRVGAAALAGFAVQAASTQQSLKGLEAVSSVTGVGVSKLAGGIRQMSRDFPIGNDGAAALVEQFTKMGVASKGSESQIISLAKSTAKLSGATGEGPAVLAEGMTALSRATGNNSLDPKRFERLSDSLTTISATSGASAGSILAFSKNIAPMANAAGIGATGVLGISSSFAKLGEDGIGASTAVNKMLSDMNRAVRDGGPGVQAYATIVGKTADQFSALYKSNPAGAITQVTEALAKSGSAGGRQLELIGLDSVRTQRSLQAVSAAGGMGAMIKTATDAYGSGSTEKASQAAFGGLNDSLEELKASTTTLASAFGAPLLAPLTMFTKGLTSGTGLLTNMVSGDKAQKTLAVVGSVVGLAVLAKTALATLGTLGIGRQMATSGGVRAFAAGFGREGSRMASFGGRATELANSQVDRWGEGGQLGHVLHMKGPLKGESVLNADGTPKMRVTGGMERKLWAQGQGLRTGLNEAEEDRWSARSDKVGAEQAARERAAEAARPPLPKRILRGFSAYATNFAETYTNSQDQAMRNQYGRAASNPDFRKDSWVPSQGLKASSTAASASWNKPGGTNIFPHSISQAVTGLGIFHSSIVGTAGANATLRTAALSAAKALGSTALMGASVARSGAGLAGRAAGVVAKPIGRGIGAMMGLAGGVPGIVMMAGMAGYQQYQQGQDAKKASGDSFMSTDINTSINQMREQAGQATKPSVTVAEMGGAYAKSVINATKTMPDARKVSDADMGAAASTSGKKAVNYQGTVAEQAAQAVGTSVGGFSAIDLQNVKVDVARSNPFDKAKVQAIMDAIPKSKEIEEGTRPHAEKGAGGAALLSSIAPAVSTGDDSELKKTTGWRSWMQGQTTGGRTDMEALNANVSNPAWMAATQFGAGGGMHESRLTFKAQKVLSNAMLGVQQRYSDQAAAYTPGLATQNRNKDYESMLGSAAKAGNAESYEAMSRLMVKQMTEGRVDKALSPELVAEKGGVAGAVASLDKTFAAQNKSYNEDRAAQKGGAFAAVDKQKIESSSLEKSAPLFAKFFDDRITTKGSASLASAVSAGSPENAAEFATAVKTMVNSVGDSASALADLSAQAGAAANGLTVGTAGYNQAVAAQQRAEAKKADIEAGMSPSKVMAIEIKKFAAMAATRPVNEAGIKAQQEGEAGLAGYKDQARQTMTARLQVQRQADISAGYAKTDYGTQKQYAKDDYSTSVMRTKRQADLQLTRATEDYDRSVLRSREDFNLQQKNQVRDFNISIKQTEEDALKSRFRAIRDFSIQVKQQIEDAAASMLDPYSRIQSKPTWDVDNLLQNLKEQSASFAKQKANLDQARKSGLSQQAIDQLGLGKVENAQQLQNVIDDIKSRPSLTDQLNKAAVGREKTVGKMVLDPSNVALRRATQALHRNLSDNAKDLATSLRRSLATLVRNQGDQNLAFAKNLARGASDFKRSLARNAFDLSVALADMAFEQDKSLLRQEKAFLLSVSRQHLALLEADSTVGKDFNQLTDSYNKAIHGTAVNWNKTMTNDSTAMVTAIKTKLLPALAKSWADVGLPLPAVSAAPERIAKGAGGSGGTTRAEGGIIPGSSPHSKADNIHIRATAGEFMQPVDSVKHYGVGTMEAIRTKRIPREQLSGYATGGLIEFGHELQAKNYNVSEHPLFGGVHPVHAPGSQHYNKSGPGGGGAIDVNHDQGNEDSALTAIVASARRHNLRALWHIVGHFNHAHFDIAKGPDMIGADIAAGVRSGGGGITGGAPGGGSLSDVVLDKALASMGSGGLFFNNLKKHLAAQLKAAYGGGSAGSGGGIAYGGLGSGSGNAQIVYNTLTGLGFTPQAASGVIGNLMQESGVNPRSQQAGGPGRGIMQWSEGQRWATLQNWAGKRDPWALDTQVGFMVKEMNDRGFTGSFSKINNVVAATNRFEQVMEAAGTPNMTNRIAQAQNALAKFGQATHDEGGMVPVGRSVVQNNTGKPEALLNGKQWDTVKALLSKEQSQAIASAQGVHMQVIHNESIVYDQRNDFGDAKITVISNDPDDMARKLETRRTQQRVTQTVGVKSR